MKIEEKEITKIWNMVFNQAIQMLHNEEDAFDATQGIYEIVLRKIDTFRKDLYGTNKNRVHKSIITMP